MPMYLPGLEVLKLATAALAGEPSPRRVLSLSWQDVLVTPSELTAVFGSCMNGLTARSDSAAIRRWHKMPVTVVVPDWHEVLKRIGYEPTSMDVVQARGVEEVHDMNLPLPEQHVGRYSLVIDNVLGHCFNAAQCLLNILRAVKPGGLVLHVVPLVMVNHSYWTPSPCLFGDFYRANGCELLHHGAWAGYVSRKFTRTSVSETRMRQPAADSMQFVVVRKLADVPLVLPRQDKFIETPDCRKA